MTDRLEAIKRERARPECCQLEKPLLADIDWLIREVERLRRELREWENAPRGGKGKWWEHNEAIEP